MNSHMHFARVMMKIEQRETVTRHIFVSWLYLQDQMELKHIVCSYKNVQKV